jgi:hypothetical protein
MRKKQKIPFSDLDILLLCLALVFTILLFRVIYFEAASKQAVSGVIKGLIAFMWFIFFILQHKALRARVVFMAWVVVSSFQLILFFLFYNSPFTEFENEYSIVRNYSRLFASPILMVVYFQICRQISLYYYGQEMEQVEGRTGKVPSGRYINGIETVYNIGVTLIPAAVACLIYFS